MHFIWLLRPSAPDKNVLGHILQSTSQCKLTWPVQICIDKISDKISLWQGFQDEISSVLQLARYLVRLSTVMTGLSEQTSLPVG